MFSDNRLFFANYLERKPRVPGGLWLTLRLLVLLGTIGLAGSLVVAPEAALRLWWTLIVPTLPMVLVIAPGFWRQVCPMAFLNQMPRQLDSSLSINLPPVLSSNAFAMAVASFVAAVALRGPLLNHEGAASATLILGSLLLALIGGFLFKGKSGWCGTFCPLGPLQRVYGQAPPVLVPNGHCPTCLGCQKNCYDFNPRRAVFDDLNAGEPQYSAQRQLFYGLLPGLVFGYALQNHLLSLQPVMPDLPGLILAGSCCVSIAAFSLLVSFFKLSTLRTATIFASTALAIFYWASAPGMLLELSELLRLPVSETALTSSRFLGVGLGIVLFTCSVYSELLFASANLKATRTAGPDRVAGANGTPQVTDRETGLTFSVIPGASLLDAIELARLPINFGCRVGLCGADPVIVCEGSQNLSPIGPEEALTLRRLGLEGQARLACMCEVRGSVTIDRDPTIVSQGTLKVAPGSGVDLARKAGLERIVIIGNGVAGMGAAERLRRDSESVSIVLVTNEPLHFYNRMAIGRLIYSHTGMDGLQLMGESWFTDNRVDVWRNTVAVSIDRSSNAVRLGTGDRLLYDKLILATGAGSATPIPNFLDYRNAFVLRTAEDGQALRSYVQRTGACRAVIIGGGVLGIEVAHAMCQLNLQVTLLQRADQLMNGQLDRQGSARIVSHLRTMNIQVVTGVHVGRWETFEDSIVAAQLSHGPRVRGDIYIACLGTQPNTHLARAAGLDVRRGITVDTTMRTSDPDIYAIGDVAEAPFGLGGLWPIGIQQANTAVAAIFNDPVSYTAPRCAIQLKLEGLDVRSFGRVSAEFGDEEFTALPEDPVWWRLIRREGSIVGAIYVGPPHSGRQFARIVQDDIDIGPVDRGLLQGDLNVLGSLMS